MLIEFVDSLFCGLCTQNVQFVSQTAFFFLQCDRHVSAQIFQYKARTYDRWIFVN